MILDGTNIPIYTPSVEIFSKRMPTDISFPYLGWYSVASAIGPGASPWRA